MQFGNLQNWFGGDIRRREERENRAEWQRVEGAWQRTPHAKRSLASLSEEIVEAALRKASRSPPAAIVQAFGEAVYGYLEYEDLAPLTPSWRLIDGDALIARDFKAMMKGRERWTHDFDGQFAAFRRAMLSVFEALTERLPPYCFHEEEGWSALEVPLIDVVEDAPGLVRAFLDIAYTPQALATDEFRELRTVYRHHWCVASGYPPEAAEEKREKWEFVLPEEHKLAKEPVRIADLYLARNALSGASRHSTFRLRFQRRPASSTATSSAAPGTARPSSFSG